MYESPIELIVQDTQVEFERRFEDGIYKAVQTYAVKVDKEELVKALQYDREQYEKGYKDAVAELTMEAKWELHRDGSGTCGKCHRTSVSVWDYDNYQNYCGHCGAKMSI